MSKTTIFVAVAGIAGVTAFGGALYMLGPAGRGPRELSKVRTELVKSGKMMTVSEAAAYFAPVPDIENGWVAYKSVIADLRRGTRLTFPDAKTNKALAMNESSRVAITLANLDTCSERRWFVSDRKADEGVFGTLGSIGDAGKLVQLATWQAHTLARLGHTSRALDGLVTIAKLSEKIGRNPLVDVQLFRSKVDDSIFRSVAAVLWQAKPNEIDIEKLEKIRACLRPKCELKEELRLWLYLADRTFEIYPTPEALRAASIRNNGMRSQLYEGISATRDIQDLSLTDLKTPGIMPLSRAKLLQSISSEIDSCDHPETPASTWIKQAVANEQDSAGKRTASDEVAARLNPEFSELIAADNNARARYAVIGEVIRRLAAIQKPGAPATSNQTSLDPFSGNPIAVVTTGGRFLAYSVGRFGSMNATAITRWTNGEPNVEEIAMAFNLPR